jgi:hypothetical protein
LFPLSAFSAGVLVQLAKNVSAKAPKDLLVFIQPLADDSIGLLGFLPEKTVTATVDHLELRAFDMIAEVLRCRHVIARIGIDSILAADQA